MYLLCETVFFLLLLLTINQIILAGIEERHAVLLQQLSVFWVFFIAICSRLVEECLIALPMAHKDK